MTKKKNSLIIIYLEVSIFLLLLLSPIFFSIVGIEFSTPEYQQTFRLIQFWGFLFLTPLILFESIIPEESPREKLLKIAIGVGFIFFVFIYLFISIFSDMCTWTTQKTLYTHRDVPSSIIVVREYGCGAFDTSPPIEAIFRIKSLSKYFNLTQQIEVKNLQIQNWIKQ